MTRRALCLRRALYDIMTGIMKLKNGMLLLVSMSCALSAVGGEFAANGCRVVWTERTLEVGNAHFSRGYVSSSGVLRTVAFKATDGADWLGRANASDDCDVL